MADDKKIIIAVDGYSSSGKSTMARRLAMRTGYRYIDSGAMYRAVTLFALRNELIKDGVVDADKLASRLGEIKIDFRPNGATQSTLLNGEDVEKEIRSMEVSSNVSPVAAIPAVRRSLTDQQRRMGEERGIVMDGRDIGTTVFPGAELKIFVTASAETRARRRFDELRAKGDETTSYEAVLENVRQRDHIDETRAESPLRKADDAIILDNSAMTPEEQDEWMIEQFRIATQR